MKKFLSFLALTSFFACPCSCSLGHFLESNLCCLVAEIPFLDCILCVIDTQIGCHLDWLLGRMVVLAPTPDVNGLFQLLQKILFMYVHVFIALYFPNVKFTKSYFL